jgi:hypothetical protein
LVGPAEAATAAQATSLFSVVGVPVYVQVCFGVDASDGVEAVQVPVVVELAGDALCVQVRAGPE